MHNKGYYKYSEEALSYILVYKNNRHKYIKNYPIAIAGFIICAIFMVGIFTIFDTPKEKELRQDKAELNQQLHILNEKIEEIEKVHELLNTKDDSLYRMILGKEPLSSTQKEAGKGGHVFSLVTKHFTNDSFVNNLSNRLNKIYAKSQVLNKSFSEVISAAKENTEHMKRTPAIMPIYNKDLKGTGSGFGMRMHPILGIRRMHKGMDFYAKQGTDVYATADGTVTKTKYSPTFGNLVVVDHGYGIETYYAHLHKFKVKRGQKVKRGEVIALVGNTGLSSGPHLHYEVRINKYPVNPVHYFFSDLTSEQYKEIIALSERDIASMD